MTLRRIAVAVALMSLALPACRSDRIGLTYRYPEGMESAYSLVADAVATWDIGGPGRGSYRAEFEVTEVVESVEEDSAIIAVDMIPVDVNESGLPSPGTSPRSFRLRVGPNGEVMEVLEVDDIAATNLEPDQLLFIGTYRPPLPHDEVRLDDRWNSEQEVELPSTFQQIVTAGRLIGYDEDADNELALIDYDGEGPLTGTTQLPQGAAELNGVVHSESEAVFEIDGGSLRAASSSTTGDFDVRVVATGTDLPITGRMHLELDLTIEKL